MIRCLINSFNSCACSRDYDYRNMEFDGLVISTVGNPSYRSDVVTVCKFINSISPYWA